MPSERLGAFVQQMAVELAEYLTEYSDYMANENVVIKDMAVTREFMEPFKWEKIEDYKINLGESAELFSTCFESDDFWHHLKN